MDSDITTTKAKSGAPRRSRRRSRNDMNISYNMWWGLWFMTTRRSVRLLLLLLLIILCFFVVMAGEEDPEKRFGLFPIDFRFFFGPIGVAKKHRRILWRKKNPQSATFLIIQSEPVLCFFSESFSVIFGSTLRTCREEKKK